MYFLKLLESEEEWFGIRPSHFGKEVRMTVFRCIATPQKISFSFKCISIIWRSRLNLTLQVPPSPAVGPAAKPKVMSNAPPWHSCTSSRYPIRRFLCRKFCQGSCLYRLLHSQASKRGYLSSLCTLAEM